VIVGFENKGLKRFFEVGNPKGIRADHRERVRRILTRMNAAEILQDMDAPGLRLHPLKGRRKGRYAVTVSGNWRITFTFDGRNFDKVDLIDYH
jgi:proteic killer suppression protein